MSQDIMELVEEYARTTFTAAQRAAIEREVAALRAEAEAGSPRALSESRQHVQRLQGEVAALRERAERAEAVLREAPHEPHCMGQLDVRVWQQETRIICCTCFKNRYQEGICQTNPV